MYIMGRTLLHFLTKTSVNIKTSQNKIVHKLPRKWPSQYFNAFKFFYQAPSDEVNVKLRGKLRRKSNLVAAWYLAQATSCHRETAIDLADDILPHRFIFKMG